MLGMCHLRMPMGPLKMTARVARKLFATIRYRFSHLDNGLIWKTGCGHVERPKRRSKLLILVCLTIDSGLLWGPWVPVVVAD